MQEEDENEDRNNSDTTMIAQRYSTRVHEDEKGQGRPEAAAVALGEELKEEETAEQSQEPE